MAKKIYENPVAAELVLSSLALFCNSPESGAIEEVKYEEWVL